MFLVAAMNSEDVHEKKSIELINRKGELFISRSLFDETEVSQSLPNCDQLP